MIVTKNNMVKIIDDLMMEQGLQWRCPVCFDWVLHHDRSGKYSGCRCSVWTFDPDTQTAKTADED